jgi:hypothetical protein
MNEFEQKLLSILKNKLVFAETEDSKGNVIWSNELVKLAKEISEAFSIGEWYLLTEKTPERIKEHWYPEETAQEVFIQYFRAKRYETCVGWFEDGKWWCNDEVIQYPIVAWKYLPEQYQPEIEWDFVEWIEKGINDAQLKGVDDFGLEYYGSGSWADGKPLYDVRDVEPAE